MGGGQEELEIKLFIITTPELGPTDKRYCNTYFKCRLPDNHTEDTLDSITVIADGAFMIITDKAGASEKSTIWRGQPACCSLKCVSFILTVPNSRPKNWMPLPNKLPMPRRPILPTQKRKDGRPKSLAKCWVLSSGLHCIWRTNGISRFLCDAYNRLSSYTSPVSKRRYTRRNFQYNISIPFATTMSVISQTSPKSLYIIHEE